MAFFVVPNLFKSLSITSVRSEFSFQKADGVSPFSLHLHLASKGGSANQNSCHIQTKPPGIKQAPAIIPNVELPNFRVESVVPNVPNRSHSVSFVIKLGPKDLCHVVHTN